MLRCTYIILIYNNISNISSLVSSLKNIEGNLRREFIFIDDGSSDGSLPLLKECTKDLPRTTIITQQTQGPSISINKALSLATGDYIHFVEGEEILRPESTSLLIDLSLKFDTQVAIGSLSSHIVSKEENSKKNLIEQPMKEILSNKMSIASGVGKSGSLVHKNLIDKVNKSDSSVYTHYMSLSLRCAQYSKFIHTMTDVSYMPEDRRHDCDKFTSYNNLRAIYNFAQDNQDLFVNLTSELLSYLSSEVSKSRDKINYSIKSIFSKYIKGVSLDTVLKLYKQELDRLF